MTQFKRRNFIKTVAVGAAGISFTGLPSFSYSPLQPAPSYLKEYASLYKENPHVAALQLFKDSKFGLFMHYGISSIFGRGEWVQDEFNAKNFYADLITDMALGAGMKFVTRID